MIKVLSVDDNPIMLEAIQRWCAKAPDVELVGSVLTAEDAAAAAAALKPLVVLMDVDLGGADAFAVVQKLVQAAEPARVAMLTSHCDPEYIKKALEAGALGYVCKDEPPEEIINTICAVAHGKVHLSPKAEEAMRAFA